MSRRAVIQICALLVCALLALTTAEASVVRHLDDKALSRGSDLIVEGTVRTVQSSWNSDGTGLETRVDVAVQRVLSGHADTRVTITQPGGSLDGNRHIIVGMPTFAAAEAVRLYLRERPGMPGTYRVYGWAQGKWNRSVVGGQVVYRRARTAVARAAAPGDVPSFTHNGMVWPDSKIPVPYLIHQDGSEDLPLADVHSAISASFATWTDVPCSRLSYTYAGETDLQVAIDDANVLLWIESGWVYGAEAAAATSLWIPVEEERTADIAFNGEGFTWAIAPEAAISFQTLDLQSVLIHELGHFSGLSHTESALDTMYFSWRPWPGQRSLSADDKLGLCDLYPLTADECQDTLECPADDTCESYPLGTLCTSHPDAIGDACSYRRIECEHFCLFTAADLSDGYCSRFCEQPEDCPAGYSCDEAAQGEMPVKVCFAAAGGPDAGPDPGACSTDAQCPDDQYCGPDERCTDDCREAIDCPNGTQCGDRGQCLAAAGDSGGCGCQSSDDERIPSLWWLLAAAALWWRRHGRPGHKRHAH